MKNAFTVDVEDWFCTYNMSTAIPFREWGRYDLRVIESTRRLLDILQSCNVRATFFVLGWIAEKAPEMVREIDARGHEIAVHGYGHRLLTTMTPEEFREDVVRAMHILREVGVRQPLLGFRAPSFTVVRSTFWALDILRDLGFQYDSSIFPTGMHPDYGVPGAPLVPYVHANGLREFPLSVLDILGRRFPCGGGGYFRVLPYEATRMCMKRVNASGRPVAFYLHPWELDPGQPRAPLSRAKAFRQYYGLASTEKKLRRLLHEFTFAPMKEVLGL